MPTENRSSNTEQMVSVPREVAEQIASDTEHDNDLRWIAKEMRKILDQPAEQHQGRPTGLSQGWNLTRQSDGFVIGHSSQEPAARHKDQALKDGRVYVPFLVEQHQDDLVAWIRDDGGDAWTDAKKRDAVAHNGTPGAVVAARYTLPCYASVDPGDALRLRTELREQGEIFAMQEGKIDALRAQLAEALLLAEKVRDASPGMQRHRLSELLSYLFRASASAEPSAPVESDEVETALLWLDDFVARCNGDDRGSCPAIETLRAALERKS